MAVDEQEQGRKLSDAERRRLAHFEQVKQSMAAEGYQCHELTVGIVKANVITILASIPLIAVGLGLFVLVNRGFGTWDSWASKPFALLALYLVLIVVHEGVHGIAWSIFATRHFADIEFGFMKEYLTPYCTCACPLTRIHYVIGALAPLVMLGVVPTAVAIAQGSFALLLIGLVMILSAGGDIMIAAMVLRHKSAGSECLVYDHPTQAGCVVFER